MKKPKTLLHNFGWGRLGALGVLAAMAFSILVSLGPTRLASAQSSSTHFTQANIDSATFSWVDRAHISAKIGNNTVTFFDQNVGDSDYSYRVQGYGCDGKITIDGSGGGADIKISNATRITLHLDIDPSSNAVNCKGANDAHSKPVSDPNNSDILYELKGATIVRIDGRTNDTDEGVYTWKDDPNNHNLFYRLKDKDCKDIIRASPDGGTGLFYHLENGPPGKDNKPPDDINAGSCAVNSDTESGGNQGPWILVAADGSSSFRIKNLTEENMKKFRGADGTVVPGGAAATTGDASKAPATCNANGSGGPLNFIFCGVIGAVDSTLSTIGDAVDSLLNIDVNKIVNGDNGAGLKLIWSYFRNIASLLLVLVALVMVLSQALDFGAFDAYTVKKALPRLVIATILIQISFSLCVAGITIVDQIAWGIRSLMYAPFGGSTKFQLQNILSNVVSSDGGGFFSVVAAGGVGAAALTAGAVGLGTLGVMSLALSALIFLATGYFVLVLREAVILGLIVVAPIALVAWILPGTQKFWKLWWESFSKLLIMYPLIIFLIAAGRIFAYVTTTFKAGDASSVTGDFSQVVIVVIGFFGPMLFIPKTFQMSGAAFSGMSGAINNRSSGLRGKMGQSRAKRSAARRAHTLENAKSNNLFHGGNESNLRGRLNRGVQGATMLGAAGFNPGLARSKVRSARATGDLAHAMEAMDKDTAFQSIKGNDDLLAAATAGGGTMKDAEAFLRGEKGQSGAVLKQNLAQIEQAKRSMGTHAFGMAAAVANASTGTGYADGPAEMLDAIYQASGGDMTLAGNMLAQAKGRAEQAGRADLGGASYGDLFGQMEAVGKSHGTAGSATAMSAANTYLGKKTVDAKGAGALLAGRASSVKNLVPAMRARLDEASANAATARSNPSLPDSQGRVGQAKILAADRDYKGALAATAGLLDAAGSAPPEVARALADGLLGHPSTDHGHTQATRKRVLNSAGQPMSDGSGKPLYEAGPIDTTPVTQTVGAQIEAYRQDEEFGQFRREYGGGYSRERMAAMSASERQAFEAGQPKAP